jgi:hypothetical protein
MINKASFIPQLSFGIYLAHFGKLFLKGNATNNMHFLIKHKLLFSIIPFIIEKDCEFFSSGWQDLCKYLDNLPAYLIKHYQPMTVLALILYPLREHSARFFEKYLMDLKEKNEVISKIIYIYNTRDSFGRVLEGPQKLYNPQLQNSHMSNLRPTFFNTIEQYHKTVNHTDDNPFTKMIEKGFKSYHHVKSAFK